VPLMTAKGTFITSGAERVVVSQLLRSPGAYFTKRKSRRVEFVPLPNLFLTEAPGWNSIPAQRM